MKSAWSEVRGIITTFESIREGLTDLDMQIASLLLEQSIKPWFYGYSANNIARFLNLRDGKNGYDSKLALKHLKALGKLGLVYSIRHGNTRARWFPSSKLVAAFGMWEGLRG